MLENQVHSFSAVDTYKKIFSHRNLSMQHMKRTEMGTKLNTPLPVDMATALSLQ
jgi:hypothetical protein